MVGFISRELLVGVVDLLETFSPSRLSPAFCDLPPLQREHPRQPLIRESSLLNDHDVVLYATTWCNSFVSFFFFQN